MLNEACIQSPFFFAIIAFQKSYNTTVMFSWLEAILGIINSTDPAWIDGVKGKGGGGEGVKMITGSKLDLSQLTGNKIGISRFKKNAIF